VVEEGQIPPGSPFALRVIHPGSSALRVRYRSGILVTPYGLPEWTLYARSIVELPALPAHPVYAELTADEIRVMDVLAANEIEAEGDDPLWEFTRADPVARTPPGWTWAHIGLSRRLALVPIELHGSYRHTGGMSTLRGATGTGVRIGPDARRTGQIVTETVPEQVLLAFEQHLGFRLPASYRDFLGATNGATPAAPGVHPAYGFIHDQPLFGLGRDDRTQDVGHVGRSFVDRLTPDFLAAGYLQGGLLAVRVAGERPGSVWFFDDDDPRADDRQDAAHISRHLLGYCADSIAEFLAGLVVPPAWLLERADALVEGGHVTRLRPKLAGASLPAGRRAPWQPEPRRGDSDPLVAALEIR
jgi:hypothetical protein